MENLQIPPKYVCNHIWPFRNRIIGSEYCMGCSCNLKEYRVVYFISSSYFQYQNEEKNENYLHQKLYLAALFSFLVLKR